MANATNAKPLVLVTGGTGHLGLATLSLVLKKGYRARVATRSVAAAQHLTDLLAIAPYAAALSFVEVPDVLADHAFDAAVQGVDYILHLASPLVDESLTGQAFDVNKTYLQPAIQGNLNLLRAAATSPTVKRVVITSSVTILDRPGAGTAEVTLGPDDVAPLPAIDQIPPHPWLAYSASKKLANAAAQEFIATNDLPFTVVHVLPSYVQGRNDRVTSARELVDRPSSNQSVLHFVLGKHEPEPRPASLVLVDDVAATHVAAMEAEGVENGERFIAAYARPADFAEIEQTVRRLFPRQVANGVLPLGGQLTGLARWFDPSKTTEKLGVTFHGHDDMVQSLIGQYVSLVERERADEVDRKDGTSA